MSATYTQTTRIIEITTPLGKDALLLKHFEGKESVSRLFEFDVKLQSLARSVDPNALIGNRATVRIALDPENSRYRFFNGIIGSFRQSGTATTRFTNYSAVMVPWLYLLSYTGDCRIFQNKSVPDIISQIFREGGFTDFDVRRLRATYQPREYCVQYKESDFNFVSRLMEEEGISYFFEHTAERHTLVMVDHTSGFKECPDQPSARCDFTEGAMALSGDVVNTWNVEQQVRPGKYTLTDFNFEQPSLNLQASVTGRDERRFELYDYPGAYTSKDRGEHLAEIKMDAEQTALVTARGVSNCRAFSTGYKFRLERHPQRDFNQEYVLMSVAHTATQGSYDAGDAAESGEYSNSVTCVPVATRIRPAQVTPRPIVQGTQTAIVTGPAGEEIYTDKYGRVKVQFHWDREGKRDQNSSCWIRVSQPWAGKSWGAVSIPRIGQEVVVDFLEGDPDRPLITGRVYNAEQMPPYALPAGADMMGFKSDSTPGGGGYNEIVIKDGKAGEQVRIHAQKDMNTKVRNNDTQHVLVDRKINVDGKHTETVKGDMSTTVTDGHQTNNVNTGSQSNVVKQSIDIESTASGITIKAKTNITIEVGASKITMDAAGNINIQGSNIQINGGATIRAESPDTDIF